MPSTGKPSRTASTSLGMASVAAMICSLAASAPSAAAQPWMDLTGASAGSMEYEAPTLALPSATARQTASWLVRKDWSLNRPAGLMPLWSSSALAKT